jgi:hypothetical protein
MSPQYQLPKTLGTLTSFLIPESIYSTNMVDLKLGGRPLHWAHSRAIPALILAST